MSRRVKIDYNKYTTSELMACIFSRELENGTLGLIGAHALIPMAAIMLAKELHAPDLSWISGGSGYVNPSPPLVISSSDFRDRAEAVLAMQDVIRIQTSKLDFFFVGGLQFDQQGSTNLVGVGDPINNEYQFKGPGSAGVPFVSNAKRIFYYSKRHTPRVFKKKVDFCSACLQKKEYLSKDAEDYKQHILVSSLATFEFDKNKKMLVLRNLHPSIEWEHFKKQTGDEWELPDKNNISYSEPPTREELEVLRQTIDPYRLLQRW